MEPLDFEALAEIASQFSPPGRLTEIRALGSGHINDTFCARFEGSPQPIDWVLQRINHRIFPDVAGVMENMVRVTRHLEGKIRERGGDPARETLQVLPTQDGQSFLVDDRYHYWRCFPLISDSVCHDTCQDATMLEQASGAFGRFQRDLADLPGGHLRETIPGFHDTPARYRRLLQVRQRAPEALLARARPELDFLEGHLPDLSRIQEGLETGSLPWRTCHNDTKLNNVLFDRSTGEALCVIDLDTVMTGSALHDFGDAVRSAATTAAEDDPDPEHVDIDLDRYEAMLKGFLEQAGETLWEAEIRLLPFAPRLLGLELGMRFLTDFLEGNRYFKVYREGQNLDRCRNQFALVSAMERRSEAMESILKRHWRG